MEAQKTEEHQHHKEHEVIVDERGVIGRNNAHGVGHKHDGGIDLGDTGEIGGEPHDGIAREQQHVDDDDHILVVHRRLEGAVERIGRQRELGGNGHQRQGGDYLYPAP